eukprot:INCI13177.1.p1 GENE.INCI13177.1~~INCI13177.1.p1  ORF type:complete len:428 (+),score=69.23 INCI13177.1:110-1393(+)
MSATVRALELAQERRQKGLRVLDGGLGQNPARPPSFVVNAVAAALPSTLAYGNCRGSAEFQAEMAKVYGTDLVLTGNGLKPMIFTTQIAFHRLHSNHTDRKPPVIVHVVPYWPTYAEQTQLAGLRTVEVVSNAENGYKLTPEAFCSRMCGSKHLSNATEELPPHMLLLNSPTNPTGAVYTAEELRALAQCFKAHGTVVFLDEIYAHLVHPGASAETSTSGSTTRITDAPNAPTLADYYDQCMRGCSLSKVLGTGGLRFGWMSFDRKLKALHKSCCEVASMTYTAPSPCMEAAALIVLRRAPEFVSFVAFQQRIFGEIGTIVCERLASETPVLATRSGGAWYTLLDFTKLAAKLAASKNITTNEELAQRLIEDVGIVMVPGVAFGFEPDKLLLRYSFIDMTVSTTPPSYDAGNVIELIDSLVGWIKEL